MGDPKKFRKTYSTPNHPWEKARIDEEKELKAQYGIKNKKEIWKMVSILKKYQQSAKRLFALNTKQADIEKEDLLRKLQGYNLIKPNADVHDVLEITIRDILDRRLQTILIKKGLARTVQQARQFITHGHILIDGKKIDSPSYLVTEEELRKISFNENSSLIKEDHPERVIIEKVVKKNDRKETPSTKGD